MFDFVSFALSAYGWLPTWCSRSPSSPLTKIAVARDVVKCRTIHGQLRSFSLSQPTKGCSTVAQHGLIDVHLPSASCWVGRAQKFKCGGMWGSQPLADLRPVGWSMA